MKLLYINCCISVHERSRTKLLADTFLNAWREHHPADEIEELDLRSTALTPLLAAEQTEREELLRAGQTGGEAFSLARQFAAADRVVIAAPYWELSYPAQLRLYFEHISAVGLTFGYGENGIPYGMCKAGKLLYLTTAGGPLAGANYGGDHIRALCGLYGIPVFEQLSADLQDVIELDHEAILQDVLAKAKTLAETF